MEYFVLATDQWIENMLISNFAAILAKNKIHYEIVFISIL